MKLSRRTRLTLEQLEPRTVPSTTISLLGPANQTTVNDLTPTFQWSLSEAVDSTLYVSVLPPGSGLFPRDVSDLFPHNDRILTFPVSASSLGPNNTASVTLPDANQLTAGQQYYWGVEATSDIIFSVQASAAFQAGIATAIQSSTTPFSSVTVVTHGFQLPYISPGIPANALQLGQAVAAASNGLAFTYDKATGNYLPITQAGTTPADALGRSLVLVTDWVDDSAIADSGFSEAAADAFFTSLVQLDRQPGINGKLFQSPLHLLGHSRGTPVTSEVVQRLGTYFPGIPEIQMTTLDPHDFDQPNLSISLDEFLALALTQVPVDVVEEIRTQANANQVTTVEFANFFDPDVLSWANVNFHDNYFQTVARLNISSLTPNGRSVPTADIDLMLNGRAGFLATISDNAQGNVHSRVVNWYAGTTGLSLIQFPSTGGDTIVRTQVDANSYAPFLDQDPWYTAGESQNPPAFPFAQAGAPWEGTGEGFYYALLGGGQAGRPRSSQARIPVSFNNTKVGDLAGVAVPTVFNGDFASSIRPTLGRFPVFLADQPMFMGTGFEIPGWSFHGGSGGTFQGNQLVPRDGNFALQLNPNFAAITHNRLFVPPDAVQVQFEYRVTAAAPDDFMQVLFQPTTGGAPVLLGQVALSQVSSDFITAQVAIPAALRGTTGTILFQVVDGPSGLPTNDATITAGVQFDNVAMVQQDNGTPNREGQLHAVAGGPNVKALTFDSSVRLSTVPYAGYTGEVRVATGDMTGDGVEDIITGAAHNAHVKVFDGVSGAEIRSFLAYPGFGGGVYVAVGDIDSDGFADIITGAGEGAGPHVKVFSGRTGVELLSFFAYDAGFVGGVRVAAGDVNNDGFADIITGAGAGALPHVKVFSGATGELLRSFLAYDAAFSGGIFVSAGDTNGDGFLDILIGADAGADAHVVVVSGATGTVLHSFLAFTAFSGGVRVGATDRDSDGFADILAGAGPGADSHVVTFSGVDLTVLESSFEFDTRFAGGIYVG